MFTNKKTLAFLQGAKERKQDIVMMSIVRTEGSTFRKVGATMYVTSDKEVHGVLSGGCVEEHVLHCAFDVLKKHTIKLVEHDLRLDDDTLESWQEGVGCNGLIEVLIEPFYYDEEYGILGEALQMAIKGVTSVLVRSTLVEDRIDSFLTQKDIESKSAIFDPKNCLLFQKVTAPLQLLVFGVGPTCEALVNIANIQGWQTHVADTRHKEILAIRQVDQYTLIKSEEDLNTLMSQDYDAIVVMSHQFSWDMHYLQYSIASDVSYIGLLGSNSRNKKLSEAVGFDLNDTRIFAPIGLDIGAKTPEAIGLAIAAQIQENSYVY